MHDLIGDLMPSCKKELNPSSSAVESRSELSSSRLLSSSPFFLKINSVLHFCTECIRCSEPFKFVYENELNIAEKLNLADPREVFDLQYTAILFYGSFSVKVRETLKNCTISLKVTNLGS